ncbi:TetR/AcrR family transcriptional regulator [Eggerthella sinensis]|uniref:TetR/AcrR family transcriptional regulator n=2 Tax=Eggerthella sinensis TaxID=242230 RepID=A0A3N0ITQ9_9ACTN|nr:TetR/AcrR family transcriptional regulator [Eggerthella sinensis]MCB7037199.1 TetR/AcrR family transcriptional regulator; helix-turn-helix transcriptional regulator [Eggerthella sinensis]RDB70191.1 TetR/AcrR family transcriptional regulator [Eggerthella sinensis]RNM40391.1 TetR/AcrR family transcriptional regulator [Eggerthella sinensis]
MVTRQEQRERRRQEILGEALRLFVRKGYAATKVSDIAEAVGMSTGLMFHYFDSKEKLYEELVKLGVEGPMGMVGAMAAEGDALSFFEGAAAGIMGFLRDEPAMADMFVLMGNALMDEAVPEGARTLLAGLDVHTPTAEIVRRGQREGTIREGDPVALSIAFWCAIQGIAEELALNPDMPCPDSAWIVDIVRKR